MPYKRGAPNGNQHALKTGRFTRESLARRKQVWGAIRSARAALREAKLQAALTALDAGRSQGQKHIISLHCSHGSPVGD
jgi:hypothetical protein